MVQIDVTSPTVAGLGGAGGAMAGLQAYRARDLAMEAEKAQMAENAKRTAIAEAHLAQGQAQFERMQSFREKLASQRDRQIAENKVSGQTSAKLLLDAAMSAEGTTPGPMTPAEGQPDESPLAPEMRRHWRNLGAAIDRGDISGQDAEEAIKFTAKLHAKALVKRHADDLIGRIHNAVAAGAFQIDENGDGEADPEVAQMPDNWIKELQDGSADPRVVEQELAKAQGAIVQHKVRAAHRTELTGQWQQRIVDGLNSKAISQEDASNMTTVLQSLHNGDFQDKTTGYDDIPRFEMHIKAAQNGQVVAKMPWGETPMDPRALAVMAAMRAQLALTGSRSTPKPAAAPKATSATAAANAAVSYADGLFPDKASRDPGDWKRSFDAKYAELTGVGAPPAPASAAPDAPLPAGDPTQPVTDPAGLQALVNKLSPEDRARYERRVKELLEGEQP